MQYIKTTWLLLYGKHNRSVISPSTELSLNVQNICLASS